MKILVGSAAMKKHFPDFREPADLDYLFTTEEEYLQFRETVKNTSKETRQEAFYHPNLANYNWSGENPTIDELYTLKVSHMFWVLRNGSWPKHRHDVMYLQKHGAQFIQELYDVLYPIWEELHGKKRANLNQTPEMFFNAKVKRHYEHDSLHASVAYYDEPLFNRILRDGHQVAVDRNKFEALPHEVKLQLVREEVYATALERIIIPSDYTENRHKAYDWALRQTITSFSKGWFPLFIVLNLLSLYREDVNYVERHRRNADKLIPLAEPEPHHDHNEDE